MVVPKRVRNVLISIVVLLALLVAIGLAYTFFAGGEGPNSNTASEPTQPKEPVITPTAPSPNAKASAAVEFLTTPVTTGSNASITVKTVATSTCKITAVYNNVASTDSGLTQKVANDYGIAEWTWTVGADVPTGTWPVTVTCTYHTRSAVVKADLQVTSK